MIGVSSTGLGFGVGWGGVGGSLISENRHASSVTHEAPSATPLQALLMPVSTVVTCKLVGNRQRYGQRAYFWITGVPAECSHSSRGALNICNYITTPSLRSDKPELFQSSSMARGKNMRGTTCHFSVRHN